MTARVEKHAGGLAVVVPESLAKEVGLSVGGTADVQVSNGRLSVGPTAPTTLDELLAGITPENVHEEWKVEGEEWAHTSLGSISRAYGDDEPDYPPAEVKDSKTAG